MLFRDRISYHQSGRPIFYIDNDCPCLGSGVLFYVKHYNNIYFLIQQEDNNQKYSFCDLGGKTDIRDNNIIETAVREVMEETNGVLFTTLFNSSFNHSQGNEFKDYMSNFYLVFQENSPRFIYSAKSKYLIILTELNSKMMEKSTLPKHYQKITPLRQEFGDKETNNNMPRQIVWMEMNYFTQLLKNKKMHIRLKDTKMYKELEYLSSKQRKLTS